MGMPSPKGQYGDRTGTERGPEPYGEWDQGNGEPSLMGGSGNRAS